MSEHFDVLIVGAGLSGIGATAVTLVPALADSGAAEVTMLQRSPSYVLSAPQVDAVANRLRRRLGPRRAYAITRWKNVVVSTVIYQLSQRRPQMMRKFFRDQTIKQLPAGYDVDTHFKPTYGPWDQRLCLVPDGDLFRVLSDGGAQVVTDRIDRFTEHGIRLESGRELAADIVVTATGLQLLALGGIDLSVDGRAIEVPDTMAYKGTMLGGIPNFAFTFGYTNASWTLKADLVAEYVCRLLRFMDQRGFAYCLPVPDPSVSVLPMIDFQAGYILRAVDRFPKSGSRSPWRVRMNYLRDIRILRYGRVNDGTIRFVRAARASRPGRTAAEVRA